MVAVVADSAANLPADMARQLRIEVVPIYLNLGDEVYRDGADLAPADFYDRLIGEGRTASTSSPSPGDFLQAYRRTGQEEIVCVVVASSMSAVHHEAALAAREFDGRVEIVDSTSASMGEGFVAAEAARCAATGASVEEVAARATDVAGRITLYAMVDTFEFLRRSGRVTKLQAYAATMLEIKPVFRLRGGDVAPVARPRTRRRAIARVLEEALRDIGERPGHVAAVHAAAPEDAEAILASVVERANVVERLVVEVTPVIGAHTGPGMVGLAFYRD
jgi:DegV family protein with EDD domain